MRFTYMCSVLAGLGLFLQSGATAAEVGFAKNIVERDFEAAIYTHIADVDGDGHHDVIGAARDANEIVWWRNAAGDGSLWSKRWISRGVEKARWVHADDLDGDGDMDILAASPQTNSVYWWENTAETGLDWTTHTITTSFGNAISVVTADIDGDNDQDVVIAGRRADSVAWWENINGSGEAWTTRTITSDFDGARSIIVGDIDNDGDIDVAGCAIDGNQVAWWENENGNGQVWTSRVIDEEFYQARGIDLADMDGDNDLDIIACAYDTRLVSWWENSNGDGTLWRYNTVDLSYNGPLFVKTFDPDRDGDMDVVAVAEFVDGVTWWENLNGLATSWTKRSFDEITGYLSALETGDIDGDGYDDLVCAATEANFVIWYENDSLPPYRDVVSPTHPDPSYGYNNATFQADWSQGEFGGSIGGWLWVLDQNPDTVVGGANGTHGGGGTRTMSFEGLTQGQYWFHLVAVDTSSAILTETQIDFPFFVNTQPPVISSRTHPDPDQAYEALNVALAWESGGVPSGSMTRYHYRLDRDPNYEPILSDPATDQSERNFFSLETGSWYFHLVGEDRTGRLGPAGHFRVNVSEITGPPAGGSIARPQNISPAHGALVTAPVILRAGGFDDPTTTSATHQASQWLLWPAEGSETDPLWNSGITMDALATVSVSAEILTDGLEYLWMARFQSSTGLWSEWSAPTVFEYHLLEPGPTPEPTPEPTPPTPTLTPAPTPTPTSAPSVVVRLANPQGTPYIKGALFSLDVMVDENPYSPINGYMFRLYFDSAILNLVRVEDVELGGEAPELGPLEFDAGLSWIDFGAVGNIGNGRKTLTVCRLFFETLQRPTEPLRITLADDPDNHSLYDVHIDPIPHRFDNTIADPLVMADLDHDGKPDDCETSVTALLIDPEQGWTNILLPDSDNDGLLDGVEDPMGCEVTTPTLTLSHPRRRDTDEDGFSDGMEVLLLESDPADPFSPDRGNALFLDADGDGLPALMDPDDTNPDVDGDRFLDGYEMVHGAAPDDDSAYPDLGNVNDSVSTNNLDAVILFNYLLGNFSIVQRLDRGDINGDGYINNVDSILLFNWALGNVPHLPPQ